MDTKKIQLLEHTPVPKALITLALPTILGMMVQILYNLTDIFFVGKLNDPYQVAAVAIATPIFMMFLAISGILGNGGASFVSRLLGQKNYRLAKQTSATAFYSCLIVSLFVTVAALFLLPQILKISGASEKTYAFAASYLKIIVLGNGIIMLNFTASQLIRSEGGAKISMMGMMIGTGINIILDPVFIFVLHQGVSGAAAATLIGNSAGLLFYISYYQRGKSLVSIHPRYFSPKKRIYSEIIQVGLPSSISHILISLSQAFTLRIAGAYGDSVVAAIGIVMRLITIPFMLNIGLAIGAQPLIGYSYGACNHDRLKASVKISAVTATLLSTLFAILFFIFPRIFIGSFIQDTEVIARGVRILYAFSLPLPLIGIQMIFMSAMQSMGKGLPALIISACRQGLVYLPAILILNAWFGFSGFIYAQAVADFFSLLLSIAFFVKVLSEFEKEADLKNFKGLSADSPEILPSIID